MELNRSVVELIGRVQDYIYDYNIGHSEEEGDQCSHLPGYSQQPRNLPISGLDEILLLQQKVVVQVLDRLKLCLHRAEYTARIPRADLGRVLHHLHKAFAKLGELTLTRELRGLSSRPVDSSYLNALIRLGNLQCEDVYRILAGEDTLERLVRTAEGDRSTSLLCLRALSSVCCTTDLVRGLERTGGLSLVCRLLVTAPCLDMRIEAAGVLAQITSPWIAENHRIHGLDAHLPDVIGELTRLAGVECGEDSLLLISAALANLTYMQAEAVDCILASHTAAVLLDRLPTSIFTRDQIVTVVANLAARPRGQDLLLRQLDGLTYLVGELDVDLEAFPAGPASEAASRLVKKAAIALCRLCTTASWCSRLVSLGGVERAVSLCQSPAARGHSDAVLLAGLALLRRVATHIQLDHVQENLLNQSLVDSFRELATSPTHESYV